MTRFQEFGELCHDKICLLGFRPGYDINQAVQQQKRVRGLKLRIKVEEGLHFIMQPSKITSKLTGYIIMSDI